MSNRPLNSAASAVVWNDSKDKILLVKRRDVAIWTLPGGGIELNESPEDCVLREIREESTCESKIIRLVGIYTPINKLTVKTYLFECQVTKGQPLSTDEAYAAQFFDANSCPKPTFHIHKTFIEETLLAKKDPIRRELKEVTYFNLIKYFICHPVRVIRFFLTKLGIPINRA